MLKECEVLVLERMRMCCVDCSVESIQVRYYSNKEGNQRVFNVDKAYSVG